MIADRSLELDEHNEFTGRVLHKVETETSEFYERRGAARRPRRAARGWAPTRLGRAGGPDRRPPRARRQNLAVLDTMDMPGTTMGSGEG